MGPTGRLQDIRLGSIFMLLCTFVSPIFESALFIMQSIFMGQTGQLQEIRTSSIFMLLCNYVFLVLLLYSKSPILPIIFVPKLVG